jgi:hypothetical protein
MFGFRRVYRCQMVLLAKAVEWAGEWKAEHLLAKAVAEGVDVGNHPASIFPLNFRIC